ncbi:MAG: apolipoprotein N-acyltransferase [Gammaproteobacteria bacterium]|nr:apolipoprotein N-acyltransferase [Gammaproteobacteria bacterium]
MLAQFRFNSLSLLIGASYPLAFSPFSDYHFLFSLFIFIAIAFYFYLILNADNVKKLFIQSWFFGFGLFAVGVSWVFVAVKEYGHTPWFLAMILTAIFLAFLAVFFALQAVLSYKLIYAIKAKISLSQNWLIDLAQISILPIIWLLFEWIRSWLLTGFPWLYAGYSQTETALFNYAPIVGIYGVGFIVSFISAVIAYQYLSKQMFLFNKIWVVPILLVVIAIYLERLDWTKKQGNPINISMIQGNISQHDRWRDDFLRNILMDYQRLSEPYWGKTDMIIWPENAVPTFYHYLEDSLYSDIQEQVNNTGTIFITGLPFQNIETQEYYNSLLRISSAPKTIAHKSMDPKIYESKAFYYKQHLVPFGEYLPLDFLLRGLINFFNLPMSNFSVSKVIAQPLKIGGYQVAISLCYEDSFPDLSLQQLPEANYLLNLSNNGWYGDSFAPHQHLQISRFRAMEVGRELARSTTSGVSAFINHKGQIRQQTQQFIATVLNGKVQPRIGATPYVKFPIINNLGLIIMILLSSALLLLKKTTRATSQPTKAHI